MAILSGGPTVPPTCPVELRGFIPDLRRVPCVLWLDLHNDGRRNTAATLLDVYVAFGHVLADDSMLNSVTSDSLTLPIGSELAVKVMRQFGVSPSGSRLVTVSASEHPLARDIRDAFFVRVGGCRGVVEKKCWALDSAAMEEVLRRVL